MLHTFHKCFQIPTRCGEVPIKLEQFEPLYCTNAASAVSYGGLSCGDSVHFVWTNTWDGQ